MKNKTIAIWMIGVILSLVMVSIITLAACAPHVVYNVPPTETAVARTPTALSSIVQGTSTFTWSPEMDCSVCHADIVYTLTDKTLLVPECAARGDTCVTCHEEEILVKIHAGEATSRDNKVATTENCLNCHGSYEALIELTVDSQAFLDLNGNAVNPHETHQGEVDCYQCHKMHSSYEPINYCNTCHHNGLASCVTCHPE